jgi:hypothetical protein
MFDNFLFSQVVHNFGVFEPHSNLLLFNLKLPVVYGKDVPFEPFFFRMTVRFQLGKGEVYVQKKCRSH